MGGSVVLNMTLHSLNMVGAKYSKLCFYFKLEAGQWGAGFCSDDAEPVRTTLRRFSHTQSRSESESAWLKIVCFHEDSFWKVFLTHGSFMPEIYSVSTLHNFVDVISLSFSLFFLFFLFCFCFFRTSQESFRLAESDFVLIIKKEMSGLEKLKPNSFKYKLHAEIKKYNF